MSTGDQDYQIHSCNQGVIECLEAKLASANKEIERLSGKTGFCAECEKLARKLATAVKALEVLSKGNRSPGVLAIASQALAEIKK